MTAQPTPPTFSVRHPEAQGEIGPGLRLVQGEANRRHARNLARVAVDVALMVLIMVLTTVRFWGADHLTTSEAFRLGLVVSPFILGQMGWIGLYDRVQSRRWPAAVLVVGRAVLTGAVLFALAAFFAETGDGARNWILIVTSLWFLTLSLHHGLRARSGAGTVHSRVIVAGSPREAVAMRATLRSDRRHDYDVVGFVIDRLDDDVPQIVADMALGAIDDLPHLVDRYEVDQVMFCMGGLNGTKFAPIARAVNAKGIAVSLTGLGNVAVRRVGLTHVQGQPVVSIAPAVRVGWRMWIKRGVDIVVAAMLLTLFSPLLLTVAASIRIVDGHSPIFKQQRLGKGGVPFGIYKFRSMVVGAEKLTVDLTNDHDGPVFKMKGDPRITKIGGFIRKTSIDELPQLWNVLRGEMSLVGPRPLLQHEVEAAPASFRDREAVMPGMTGQWQVSGRSDTDFDQLDELDRWYVDNWSLSNDLGILAKTVPAVLLQRGAR